MDYRKKFIWALVAAAIFLAMNIATISFIMMEPFHPGFLPQNKMGDPIEEFLTRELKFTDAQLAQFRSLRNTAMHNGDTLMAVRAASIKALYDLEKDSASSAGAIDTAAAKLGKIEAQRASSISKHFSDVRKLCAPERREKFDGFVYDLLAQIGTPHGDHPGDRFHGPDGRAGNSDGRP
jgi:Spy/CpxP family protein refolding chaperone